MATSGSARSGSRAATAVPSAASRGNGAAGGHHGSAGETIEQCITRSLDQYFSNLNGAKPHALHDLVIGAVERPLLSYVMAKTGGNQSAAAELLGINRNTLRKKLLEHRLA
jgi:Fis family transcriptional regulator, factor for inversion stimulation protein